MEDTKQFLFIRIQFYFKCQTDKVLTFFIFFFVEEYATYSVFQLNRFLRNACLLSFKRDGQIKIIFLKRRKKNNWSLRFIKNLHKPLLWVQRSKFWLITHNRKMWIKNSSLAIQLKCNKKKGLWEYQEFHDLPRWHSNSLKTKQMIDADTMREGINKLLVIIYIICVLILYHQYGYLFLISTSYNIWNNLTIANTRWDSQPLFSR